MQVRYSQDPFKFQVNDVTTDVSTSFKRLQAEKRTADQVLKELTPVESITDVEGLRDHFKSLDMKTQVRVLSPSFSQILTSFLKDFYKRNQKAEQ